MSITGPGSMTALNLMAQNNMYSQLDKLSGELGTGQVASTYSGLESQAGLALELSAQVAAIDGYSNTVSTVGTTLSIAQSALSGLNGVGTAVQQAISKQGTFTLDSSGQTTTQESASTYLDQILGLLNTQVGQNYLFSGSGVDQPSTASVDAILNGTGAQAGLTQIMSQRLQADEGVGGLGRLTIGGTGADVTVSSDTSPFGFKLASVNSNLTGATVSGSPPSVTVNLAGNPNSGDTISFGLTLPDGTSQTIALQATTAAPPGTGQFTIGATAADTASNLQTALTSAVSSLAQTALPAASAVAASNNFFADPPQVVDAGSPPDYATATSLQNGTPANTVFWYTGENGSTPALQTPPRSARLCPLPTACAPTSRRSRRSSPTWQCSPPPPIRPAIPTRRRATRRSANGWRPISTANQAASRSTISKPALPMPKQR